MVLTSNIDIGVDVIFPHVMHQLLEQAAAKSLTTERASQT
jgi:hypothetical protein